MSRSCGRIQPSSTRVTGPTKLITNWLAGRSYRSRGEPTCSIRPLSMTTMVSATSIASSWSWVTNTVVTCVSSCSRRSQARSSLRTRASSAPKGSSSSSTSGSTASARASAIRCRWPPDSCAGYRSPNCSIWTRWSSSETRRCDLGLRPLADGQPEGHVVAHRHVLEGRVVLEHEADAPLLGRHPRDVAVAQPDRPLVGRLETRDDPQERRLAAARRTQERRQLAVGDVQGDAVERDEGPEPLDQSLNPDGHRDLSCGACRTRTAASRAAR